MADAGVKCPTCGARCRRKTVDIAAVLQRFHAGETLTDLAKAMKISRSGLRDHLQRLRPDQQIKGKAGVKRKPVDIAQIKALRARNYTWFEVGARLGCDWRTARARLEEHQGGAAA